MSASDRRAAAQALVTLRTKVDAHFTAAVEAQPDAFRCAQGCSQCCHARFGVFEIEAEPLRQALREMAVTQPELRQRVRDQAADPRCAHHCALLVDDRCSVYAARPTICRSHGLAISVDTDVARNELDDAGTDSGPRVDHCPLNFQGEEPYPAHVLALSRVNATLSVAAQIYDANAPRVALADLAAQRSSATLQESK